MRFIGMLLGLGLLLARPVFAVDELNLLQSDGSHQKWGGVGDAGKVTLDTSLSGEDQTNGVFRVESQMEYEDVAAGQTAQVIGGTGAVGDLLYNIVCVFSADPSTGVSIKDGVDSNLLIAVDPGAAGVYNSGALNWVSKTGAWQLTTGTNTTCRVGGRFS